MKKLWLNIKKIINKIAWRWNIHWSNFYWRREREDVLLEFNDRKRPAESADAFVKRSALTVWDNWTYKHDGWEQLRDSTPPPPYAYKMICAARCKKSDLFKDDCDGYHAGLYHFLAHTGFDVYLLSILSVKTDYGHCVTAYRDETGRWHIHDYLTDYADADTLEELIEKHYNDVTGGEYVWGVKTWDYRAKKYKGVTIK